MLNNAKLLSELPFFEKSIKATIKQLSTKKLLQKQPFYKQSTKKTILKRWKTMNYYVSYHFRMLLIFQENKGHLEGMPRYKVEVINNKSLSDWLHVRKNSIKKLFDELWRGKRCFKYSMSVRITLGKGINVNEFISRTVFFNSPVKMVINRRYHLNEPFEEILNLFDIWIN